MPRLPPSVVRSVSRLNKHVPRLLQECGDIESAHNEIRWMKESILDTYLHSKTIERNHNQSAIWARSNSLSRKLDNYVGRRARGEPLQYILGSQPFGELDIKCKPQVLIPRGETEVYTTELAKILSSIPTIAGSGLTVADICTGSGCIALLLYSLLRPRSDQVQYPGQKLSVHGFDVSQHALKLASENLRRNVSNQALHEDAASQISFHDTDVLALASLPMMRISAALPVSNLDVIVSNPPYISPQQFSGGTTSRSVRKFEPKLALVPPEVAIFPKVQQADQFYVALLRIALAERAKLLVMEVGDTAQALRVMQLCMDMRVHADHDFEIPHKLHIELWKDDGQVIPVNGTESLSDKMASQDPLTEEESECRAVVVWLDQHWITHRLQNAICRPRML